MSQNIEMNVKKEDGTYEAVYPQTIAENVIGGLEANIQVSYNQGGN